MLKILSIFHTVETILKESFRDKSQDFLQGFETCLALFETGIKKGTIEGKAVETYNNIAKIHELNQIIKNQRHIIEKKDAKIKILTESLGTKSITTGDPQQFFKEFLIETPVGNFSIVANMTSDTCNACLTSFNLLHEFKQIDEGKSKLLMFINSKQANGFKAYKNAKEAIREGEIIK